MREKRHNGLKQGRIFLSVLALAAAIRSSTCFVVAHPKAPATRTATPTRAVRFSFVIRFLLDVLWTASPFAHLVPERLGPCAGGSDPRYPALTRTGRAGPATRSVRRRYLTGPLPVGEKPIRYWDRRSFWMSRILSGR